ncbi:MAG TPA: hypothetical protein VGG72_30645 [Bryobacteraceae bacterium]|jgi:hypothetical protein
MKFSTLLLPNRAFSDRMKNIDSRTRRMYWVLRIVLSIAAILLLTYFGARVPSWRLLK